MPSKLLGDRSKNSRPLRVELRCGGGGLGRSLDLIGPSAESYQVNHQVRDFGEGKYEPICRNGFSANSHFSSDYVTSG